MLQSKNKLNSSYYMKKAGILYMVKVNWKAIFIIYILLLVNFVILKFTGDIDHVISTIQNNWERRTRGEIAVNFIPFRTIGS